MPLALAGIATGDGGLPPGSAHLEHRPPGCSATISGTPRQMQLAECQK